MKKLWLDKDTVKAFELITDEHRQKLSSGLSCVVADETLIGSDGLVEDAFFEMYKNAYIVAIEFFDEKKSLLSMSKRTYDAFVKEFS